MRIACVGYRDWALEIYDELARQTEHQFLIFRSREQYDELALKDFHPELVLFYGWSWVVSEKIIGSFNCIMLHPSPLPKYRGGSPLQNQIIAGETLSAVTLFLMNDRIDSGPILAQRQFSLEGNIKSIFGRITKIGIELTYQVIQRGLNPVEQNDEEATIYRRRKAKESELTFEELQNQPAIYIYNKIRMLQPPYPSAYINTADGKRIVITNAYIENTS